MCVVIDYANLKYTKRLFIQSSSAEPVPPLGTILGNLGVNTVSFCNDFNIYTKNLPIYFVLKVFIYIYENKSVVFSVDLPSTGFILNLLKFNKVIKFKLFDRINEKSIACVKISCVLKLAKMKFPALPLKKSTSIIFGSLKSMQLIVV